MRTSLLVSFQAAAMALVLAACASDADRASMLGPQFDEGEVDCDGGSCVECVGSSPWAYAGPNQEVAPGSLVQLAGAAEFSGCQSEAWIVWKQVGGPTVVLGSVSSLSPTFTAPNAAAQLVFELKATDDWGTGLSHVTVSVTMSIGDHFANLIGLVNAAGLEKNTAKSLISLLQNAAAGYEKGDTDGALDKLNSFIAQVSALKKKIPHPAPLIDAANALITAITES